MFYQSFVECIGHTPLVQLQRLFAGHQVDVFAKLEFLNPGGSIKERPARFIIEHGLRAGTIHAGTHLVESSSGNFGIALATLARLYGLSFTCVVDPLISSTNLQIMRLLGANIEMVHERDDQGGYLKTRIQRVKQLLAANPHFFWANQYANQLNWQAYYHTLAAEIIDDLDGPVDYLVAAVSTTGTIMGISRRLREAYPRLRVVAVDADGSVIFGGPPKPRSIPGIGSSRVPELLCRDEIDQVVYVDDAESIRGCYTLLTAEGIFAGGSSGAVVAGLQKLVPTLERGARIVTLFPDRGERYLSTIYREPAPVDEPTTEPMIDEPALLEDVPVLDAIMDEPITLEELMLEY